MDSPDVIVWRLAADSMNLAVATTKNLCNAVEVHGDPVRSIAERRVASLRQMGSMLLSCAEDFDRILAGEGERTLDEIAAEFTARFGEGGPAT